MSDTNDPQPERRNRAKPESFRARSVMPSLTATDFQKSLAWYRDVVGFTVEEEYKDGDKVMGASLIAGEARLMINQDDGKKGWDRAKGEGFALYFTTAQNVDEIAKRIKDKWTELLSEPADMPWGSRMFRVKDPDGFILAIGSQESAT
jgi:uncharacterized glyoxalase superfamily protein PhnB